MTNDFQENYLMTLDNNKTLPAREEYRGGRGNLDSHTHKTYFFDSSAALKEMKSLEQSIEHLHAMTAPVHLTTKECFCF